ncbi:MAG: serine/threonine protein kinase [Firmicutes bacterium]|nr:serine/threonine protein kinase [Bacillota bacterium]
MEYTIGSYVFGDWQITRAIGEGSFGKVFEIQKTSYGITTSSALKVIRVPKSQADIRAALSDGMDEKSVTTYFQGFVEELVKEITIMSSLKSHPGIVSYEDHLVIDHAGEIGWDILIRMELLQSLTDYQLSHTINEDVVRKMAIDLTAALTFCQTKALIHRDIKPENIFVNELGQFKLGDFGVARTAEKTTGGLSKKGTEGYMAPEVYLAKPYGATVDIYSLGLVLYKFMNYNRLPFLPAYPAPITFADRENAMVKRMQGTLFPPPAAASPEFADIILKACAYLPEDRYHTAGEMLQALQTMSSVSLSGPEQSLPADLSTEPSTEGTIGIWAVKNNVENADDQQTDGIWNAPIDVPEEITDISESTEDSDTVESPAPQPPVSFSIPQADDPVSYAPVPAPQKKTGNKVLLAVCLSAIAVILIFVIGKFAVRFAPKHSNMYENTQDSIENSVSDISDIQEEFYDTDSSMVEESSFLEESVPDVPQQPQLNLDEDALVWDEALNTMFLSDDSHMPLNGMDVWSMAGVTPAALAQDLVSNGFIFYQADGTYGYEPYYFDAVNTQTGTTDVKYFVALPTQAYTLKCMRSAGKIYVVTDPLQSEIIFIKWGWDYENDSIEDGLADYSFSQSLPWGTAMSSWSAEDILYKSYFSNFNSHYWAIEQPGYIQLTHFDLSYTRVDDPDQDNAYSEIDTISVLPNEYYHYISGTTFVRMDITKYDLLARDQHHNLTILYHADYEPTHYILEDFWEPEKLDISDDEEQARWTTLIDTVLGNLGTTLSSGGIDYSYASLSSLQSSLMSNGFTVYETQNYDSGILFWANFGSAWICVQDVDVSTLDAERHAGTSFRRFLTVYYDPSSATADADLTALQSVFPAYSGLPVLGTTHHQALAALNIPQDLFYSLGETLSSSWWEGDKDMPPIYSLNTYTSYWAGSKPYEEDDWLKKEVLRRRRFSLSVSPTTDRSYSMSYYYGYFNGADDPTVYLVQYMIQE